jgi:hypothetical protein
MITVRQSTPIINDDDDLELAAELLKKKLGHKISPATLWRWHKKGCRGVRLPCKKVGGFLYTTPACVAAFIMGQNPETGPAAVENPEANMPPTRPVDRARKLEEAGLIC